jgi:hypothetical protein
VQPCPGCEATRLSARACRDAPARIAGSFDRIAPDMIELNPVRQRIADLKGRLDALRGYL